jgi:acyl carrier protein
MNDINLKIRQILKDKLGVDESELKNETKFYDDLAVDSLDFCEVIVDIEKAFDISIPDEDCAKFKTLGSLVKYVTHQKYQVAA